MKTIPLSDAKAGLSRIIDEISKTRTSYRITRGGVPEGVLLNSDEYDALIETLEILSDPELMKQITKSAGEIESGKLLGHDEVFG